MGEGNILELFKEKLNQITKTFPASPGDVLTVVSGKYCQIQVIYKDQLYDVEEFVRVVPEKGKPKMTYEELSKKRSELGRMGRRTSPFG